VCPKPATTYYYYYYYSYCWPSFEELGYSITFNMLDVLYVTYSALSKHVLFLHSKLPFVSQRENTVSIILNYVDISICFRFAIVAKVLWDSTLKKNITAC